MSKKLYIWRLDDAGSSKAPIFLDDEEDMAPALYVTLTDDEYDSYQLMRSTYDAWQEKLKPMHEAVRKQYWEDRDLEQARQQMAKLKAKYGDKI